MKRFFSSLPVLLLLLTVSACSQDDLRCAILPGGSHYCLQYASDIQPFDVQQIIEITLNDRRETMIVELEVDQVGMRFAGLTPFGQKLVQASFDNHQAKAELMLDKRLEPTLLLTILQLALWPIESVRTGLDGSALLDETAGQRRILDGDNLILEVSYTGDRSPFGNMQIKFPSARMALEIKTLDTNSTK